VQQLQQQRASCGEGRPHGEAAEAYLPLGVLQGMQVAVMRLILRPGTLFLVGVPFCGTGLGKRRARLTCGCCCDLTQMSE
jgi:hypothetical protein